MQSASAFKMSMTTIFLLLLVLAGLLVMNRDRSEFPSSTSSEASKMEAVSVVFLEAVQEGRLDEVREYLDGGVDVNTRNSLGEGALHLVRDTKIAALLIEGGADLEMRDAQTGMTPLFFQDGEIMRLLIKAGANVDARSDHGNTPLMWYAYSGYKEGITLLLHHGADIEARNADGQTALDIAERFADPEVSAFLLSAGAARKD